MYVSVYVSGAGSSVEIYLSISGVKQQVTLVVILVPAGGWGYIQQWYARDTILRCTVVLVEGGYKRGGRGGRASRS
jgi:hypothetical protein